MTNYIGHIRCKVSTPCKNLSTRHLVRNCTITTWEDTRYLEHTCSHCVGIKVAQIHSFCSIPLVPLVGERIVTTQSLSNHSMVTTWGVLLCISTLQILKSKNWPRQVCNSQGDHPALEKLTQCSILPKKVTCTWACNFKKLHAHNLVYMHMMLMKYMHKIYMYVVLQAVVIPCDILASISSFRRAPLMCREMPHHLQCTLRDWNSTFSSCWGWADSSVFLSSSFSTTFSFSLSLLDTRLKFLFFIIVLCTSTNIVKQVIENLYAHVHVGWKILLAPRKKYMHLCKCACLKWSTELTAIYMYTCESSAHGTDSFRFHRKNVIPLFDFITNSKCVSWAGP